MKLVASWFTLIRLAKAVGRAKKSGDTEAIEQAEKALRDYEEFASKADEVSLGQPLG